MKARCACGVWIIGDRARWAVPTCVGCLPPPRPLPLAKPIAVLLVLLSLVGCAGTFGGPERRGALEPTMRTTAATLAVGLIGVDALQTRWMTDNYYTNVMPCPCEPGKPHGYEYVEINPLLGHHPSKLVATAYLGTMAAGIVATRVWAPKWVSWAVSGVAIAAELYTVNANAQNGEPLW